MKKLEVRTNLGEAVNLQKHWERRWEERKAVVTRFLRTLPDSRFDAIEPVFTDWGEQITDPQWLGDRTAPALARWVVWLDGRGWIPPAFPEVLIDLYLAHPEADVSSYDCEECGLTMPSEPSRSNGSNWTKAYPYLEVCPHCSGRVVYNGYFNKHRQTSRVD